MLANIAARASATPALLGVQSDKSTTAGISLGGGGSCGQESMALAGVPALT